MSDVFKVMDLGTAAEELIKIDVRKAAVNEEGFMTVNNQFKKFLTGKLWYYNYRDQTWYLLQNLI